MARLRAFVTVLLAVALLPWGALVHAAQTAPKAPPGQTVEAPLPAQAAPVLPRCRTATLPGAVCRLDFAPDDDGEPPLPLRSDPVERAGDRVLPADWAGTVPQPPPRLN